MRQVALILLLLTAGCLNPRPRSFEEMYPQYAGKPWPTPKGPGPPELIELGEEMADYMAESWDNSRSEHLQQQQNQELRRMNRNLEAIRQDLGRPYYDW